MTEKNTQKFNGHTFPYIWRLSDGYPSNNIQRHKCKVFGTFICGGGSSMGYKLAGYDHLGGVELDPKVAQIYKINHHPKYLFIEDIRDFNERADLPEELYQLDILDGSPPCSTFSTAGSREAAWGKEKQFAEGQKKQRLDDLVFVYCDTIKKLKPKVCWLENVSGLAKGNGKVYLKKIVKHLDTIGYNVQVFLLNAAQMGVPQKRERVFVIGLKKEFRLPKLVLNFSEPPILFKDIDDGNIGGENKIAPCDIPYYDLCKQGEAISKHHPKGNRFNSIRLNMNDVPNTLAAGSCLYHPLYKRGLNNNELLKLSTFPMDYNWGGAKITILFGNVCAANYDGANCPPNLFAVVKQNLMFHAKHRNKITTL